MNILHTKSYGKKLVLGMVLLLALMNFGSAPAMAGPAGPTTSVSPPNSPLAAACSPSIAFTHKPPVGSLEQFLYGRVDCANPNDYKVAVYIYVTGWWNKPSWNQPLTTINADGTWKADVVIEANQTDRLAVQYAAFLLPNGESATLAGGGENLPADMFTKSATHLIEARRTIQFSGYTWNVKATALDKKIGPGPNRFSMEESDVWVDANGNLHLTISEKDGKWYCSEVYTTVPLGYGTYTFTLASRVDQLDKNAVLGLFTWDPDAPANHYREIDIEFSRWGQDVGDNAQYVVQPYDTPGNRHTFPFTLAGPFSIHSFKWETDNISFTSNQGYLPALGAQIESWSYTGADVPPAGAADARINLWLNQGVPPSDGQRIEVVIESFQYPTVFSDIPDSHWAWAYIQRLYDAGITGGCGVHPFRYCTEQTVTRAQMAVFLEKGIHGSSYSPPNVSPTFNDTVGTWAEDWIDGVTGGCGGGNYCPDIPVTRAQMAVFLLKSKYGSSYTPPDVGASTGFNDVPVTHWAAPWIKQLAAEGITGGCGSGNYCPNNPVNRAQMAVFLVKTFNLP